jgi:hypothetical protein
MATENLVSIQLSAEALQRARAAIDELKAVLEPVLVSMNADERIRLPKMGDGTEPFVEKTLDYAGRNPEFMPPYMQAEQLQIDYQAVKDLNTLYRPLQQLVSQLDDSIMLSGSEAFTASLAYYNSVKLASRLNIGGAKVIFDDLRQRFKDNGKRSSSDTARE